jgi:hypothetical protein
VQRGVELLLHDATIAAAYEIRGLGYKLMGKLHALRTGGGCGRPPPARRGDQREVRGGGLRALRRTWVWSGDEVGPGEEECNSLKKQ